MSDLPTTGTAVTAADRPSPASPDPLAQEARTNRLTATALLVVTALALVLILAGLVTSLADGDRTARPLALADLTSQHDPGPLLLGLGLLALAAAPGLGILVTVARWLRAGDWRYSLLAVLVVALLLGGALLG